MRSARALRCPIHQLVKLTGRRHCAPQRVELETRDCTRQGSQQTCDHRKVIGAVKRYIQREIDFMLDGNIEQRKIIL